MACDIADGGNPSPQLVDHAIFAVWLRAGLVALWTSRADDRQRHVCGQDQRRLVLWREGLEQLGQSVAAVPPPVVHQRPPGVRDVYQSDPPVFGVVDPGRQALPLQTLDQLGHRRLGDALRRGQRREPDRTFLIEPAQR